MSLRRFVVIGLVLGGLSAAQAATHEVSVISFRFQPENLTIRPGDTVVWRNGGGIHNVVADDGTFSSGPASSANWSYSHRFDVAGDYGYYCEPHGGPGGLGMAGSIKVEGAGGGGFEINYGSSGTWYNPETSGQGFFVEVVPSLDLLVFSWFTWSATATGDHDWLTGLGPIQGDSAQVTLQRTSGGRFDDPTPVTNANVGTATVRFTDCSNGTVTFTRTDNLTSGTIPIRRLTATPTACTSPTAE